MALWKLKEGTRARRFAFGVVALATLFIALWVGLGNGLDSHGPNKYETPTPVRISDSLMPRLTTDTVWLVLVLDWSSQRRATLRRGICLALDRFVCLSDNVHPTPLHDRGPLVN